MLIHKLHVNARYSVGLDAFLVKMTFFDPSDPIMTSDPTIVCAWVAGKVPVTVTKFGQNQMSGSMWKWRVARKKKKKEETSKKHYPAVAPAG